MFKKSNVIMPLALSLGMASLTTTSAFASDVFNAKSLSMGGVGVAGADPRTGALLNPALVDFDKSGRNYSINTNIGILGSDEDELVENAEDLEEELDDIDNSIPSNSEVDDIVDLLEDMDGAEAEFNFGTYVQFSIAMPHFSIAPFVNVSVDTFVTTDIASADIAALNAAAGNSVFDSDTLDSEINVLGGSITELGVTVAKTFNLPGATSISLGLTPKYQGIEIYDYNAKVNDYDDDDFDDRDNESSDSHFNVDAGLHIAIADSFVIGAVVKNLNEEEFETERDQEIDMEMRATAGAAYKLGRSFVEVDVDLDSAKEFLSQQETQMLRVGAQLGMMQWADIRFGYRHDLEDNANDLFIYFRHGIQSQWANEF